MVLQRTIGNFGKQYYGLIQIPNYSFETSVKSLDIVNTRRIMVKQDSFSVSRQTSVSKFKEILFVVLHSGKDSS